MDTPDTNEAKSNKLWVFMFLLGVMLVAALFFSENFAEGVVIDSFAIPERMFTRAPLFQLEPISTIKVYVRPARYLVLVYDPGKNTEELMEVMPGHFERLRLNPMFFREEGDRLLWRTETQSVALSLT